MTVNGQTVLSVLSGMGNFQSSAVQILARHGIINAQATGWYPQQAWLDAFREIYQTIGPRTLYQIGLSIPRSAKFPPGIDTLEKALGSIDVAYHMNHRGGEIGHYVFQMTGPTQGTMVCRNPYPCDFDRGILDSITQRFKPNGSVVRVQHDAGKPCRSRQGDSCTFMVSW